jgi:hypothetical protein
VPKTSFASQLLFFGLFAAVEVFPAAAMAAQRFQHLAEPSHVHRVAIIDEDSRQTEAEFAKKTGQPLSAVQRRFAATGQFRCRGAVFSGQVTGKHDVVTTAAHGFYDLKSCKPKVDRKSCTFAVTIGAKRIQRRVKSVEGTVFQKCVNAADPGDDWAVVRLDRPIAEATPYDVNPYGLLMLKNEKILSVSAGAFDFFRPGVPAAVSTNMKTIDECQIMGVDRSWGGLPHIVETDCDTGKGNSGGSVLRHRDGRDVLLGIHSGNDEIEGLAQRVGQTGVPNKGNYRPNEWASYFVNANGVFFEALQRALEKPSGD